MTVHVTRSTSRVGFIFLVPAVLIAAVASPAFAAATDEDMRLVGFVGLSLALLVFSVPSIGFGFVLGSFLSFSASVLVVLALAITPSAWTVASRGAHVAVELAPVQVILLLAFGPLIYLGWRLGRKDTKRHTSLNRLVAGNGN